MKYSKYAEKRNERSTAQISAGCYQVLDGKQKHVI